MLVEKRRDRVVRRRALPGSVVDVEHLDRAAGLAVVRREALGLVERNGRLGVPIIVYLVGPTLDPQRRREWHLLAALQHEHRVAVGHVLVIFPEGALALGDIADPRFTGGAAA